MRRAYFEIPADPVDPGHQDRIGRLWNAMRAGERLMSYRRRLTVIAAVLSAPLLFAWRAGGGHGETASTVMATAWGLCLASIARLVWLERRNERLTGELLAEVRARPL
jgi:hypothetical protein